MMIHFTTTELQTQAAFGQKLMLKITVCYVNIYYNENPLRWKI